MSGKYMFDKYWDEISIQIKPEQWRRTNIPHPDANKHTTIFNPVPGQVFKLEFFKFKLEFFNGKRAISIATDLGEVLLFEKLFRIENNTVFVSADKNIREMKIVPIGRMLSGQDVQKLLGKITNGGTVTEGGVYDQIKSIIKVITQYNAE